MSPTNCLSKTHHEVKDESNIICNSNLLKQSNQTVITSNTFKTSFVFGYSATLACSLGLVTCQVARLDDSFSDFPSFLSFI